MKDKEKNELILKKIYSENGDMTRFNRAYKLADEWNKLQTKEMDNDAKSDRYKELEKLDKDYVLTDIYNDSQSAIKWYGKDMKEKIQSSKQDMAQDKTEMYKLIDKIEVK